jgi:hypothetical protein
MAYSLVALHKRRIFTQPASNQVYVQKRNEVMLEDTADGFREGRWEWNIQRD